MADDVKHIRECYQSDLDDWSDAREARAKDMKNLAGDPWDEKDRDARDKAMRPILTCDELSQYVNQIVNEVRANPRAVQFSPTGPGTSEKAAQFYADKWREIEYRSNAQLAYTTAFENAVMGSYGFVRLTTEFERDSVDRQQLIIKPVPDPNTILPNWSFQRPDLSDMTRCFVLEWRDLTTFRQQYPTASTQSFDSYQSDDSYKGWFKEKQLLLAEFWQVTQVLEKLMLVQPPTVQPPRGQFGFRASAAPPPITIKQADWAKQPAGTTFLRDREAMRPKVTQQIINGVEVLAETTWPGPYIPIAGCMGRVLYLDGAGKSERKILSAVRLALESYMAFCFVRTCEVEATGFITKNPYWAYEGQITPEMENRIAESIHQPVALLTAKATTEATGPMNVLPLPQRNPMALDLGGYSQLGEELRRSIQSSMGTNFLPSSAQAKNEKSGKALDSIKQAAMKGSYHFVDGYNMMLRHMGCLGEAALDTVHDTPQQAWVRKANEQDEQVWINSPQQKDSIDIKGHYLVTVSQGPDFDSTQDAADAFTESMLNNQALMQLLGPQKAQQVAGLLVKLKVKQQGLGPIGEEIVEIISPPQEGDGPNPQALQQALQQADQLLQQAMQRIQQLEQDAKVQTESKVAVEQVRGETQAALERVKGDVQAALLEIKGQQAIELQRVKGSQDLTLQNDEQAHETGLAAADAAQTVEAADKAMLAGMAKPDVGGKSNGAAEK